MSFDKYIKYKKKYLNLKKIYQSGGDIIEFKKTLKEDSDDMRLMDCLDNLYDIKSSFEKEAKLQGPSFYLMEDAIKETNIHTLIQKY